ncbi:hypothetical protein N7453_008260 [Penicillium expansum]|nr:hypothetical protein N7453_008260 [Penicillium expansum]
MDPLIAYPWTRGHVMSSMLQRRVDFSIIQHPDASASRLNHRIASAFVMLLMDLKRAAHFQDNS